MRFKVKLLSFSDEKIMLDQLKQNIFSSEPFQQLVATEPTPDAPKFVRGIAGSLRAFVAAHVWQEFQQQVLVVVPENDTAEQMRDDCALLVGDANVRLYLYETQHASQSLDMSASISQVETLKALSANVPGIYITHALALGFFVPEKKEFVSSVIELSANGEYNFQSLLLKLEERGFERKPLVETYGDVAVRGGIIDIFPFIGDNPVRLEFWGDMIESIREFDVLSQRSIRELQQVSIVPEMKKIKSENEEKENITTGVSLLEYFSSNTILFLEDTQLLEKEFLEIESEGVECDCTFDSVQTSFEKFPRFIHEIFTTHNDALQFNASKQPATNGSVKVLLESIQRCADKNFDVIIASDTKEESKRIQELIEETTQQSSSSDQAEQHAITRILKYFTDTFHSGFIFPAARIALFVEHEVFGRIKRRGTVKHKRFKGISAKELHSLRRGDFVVHVDHGIGKFIGLRKIKVGGVEQEVAALEYAEAGTLFVNLNFITRIQKYSSAEGHTPKLNRLGSADWEKLKSRTKKKVKDIARDLIKLYAQRKHSEGFAFQPDTHWQKEMEASFMYEDTPDQYTATADVKVDMENINPMDRLVCGDVGFGKTEVAVRAAFKAVMNNKQAVVLVPTTILAQQHFNTFSDRLSRYPVRIGLLSRFKSAKEQKTILAALKDGTLDIIIGTHRLLSKDVEFKDLGLLVVDEEQRFGVAAKEKLRAMRITVDTLTLTATPIPRTLHFSLMGARDLSIINTPPRNRLPIHTEIATFDKKIIREAILKELHRGGQVFVVNDRVHNIDMFTSVLQQHIPEARFRVAHGQMHGHELENVIMGFLEKKFDVLVTTKIIESGVDIPSVNTIIINRADHFGLAELYQLRGRVGRSNVQAYAYLLVPPIAILPKQTLHRLQAIEEFTELGSGFNLAMRDLEIRGSGNMLGAEQSGYILEMGFEMYTKILEEAVAELKEQEFSELFAHQTPAHKQRTETQIEADIDAYIPEVYIENDTERLDIYRRLYKTTTVREADDMRLELIDRFGEAMEEVENLFSLAMLRIAGNDLGFRKVELNKRTLRLYLPPETDTQFYEGGIFQTLMERVGKITKQKIELKQIEKTLFLSTLFSKAEGVERVDEAKKIIEQLSA